LSDDSLQQAERALADWQQQWDDFTQRTHTVEQTRIIEQTRAEQIESRIASLAERRKKLEAAKSAEDPDELKHKFERIAVSEQRTRQARDEFDRHLKDIAEKIRKLRGQDEKLNRLVDERRTTLQEAEARYASMHAVQQAAMGQSNEAVKGWLEASGMQDNKRVVNTLDVEDGWERAVETVLGDYLQAVCTSNIDEATASIAKFPKGNITLLVNQSPAESGDPQSASLAGKVRKAPAAVLEMLRSVRVAESLQNALVIRAQIGDAGSVITADGLWLSNNWLRVKRDKDAKAGVLGREHDMRRLKTEIREFRVRCDIARKLVKDGRSRLIQLEQRRETVQRDAAALLNEYSEVKASLDAARYKLDQANARQAAISEEHGDIEREEFAAEEQVRVSRLQFSSAVESLTEFEQQRESLESQREELRAEMERVREQAQQDRQSAQDMAIQFETRRSSKDSAAQNLERMQAQLSQFRDRQSEISEQLQQSEEPLENNRTKLAHQLDARVSLEAELGESRRRVEQVEHDLRDLDQTRMQIDQQTNEARSAVGDARMALQEVKVRREGFSDQLGATDFALGPLLEEMDAQATIDSWEEKLAKVERRIERLGPINLAAIDEFKEQSDRKEYLDSQLADLNTALETLDNAIRKIDRETRTRFRETFANINSGFKRLFPKLFGGGHAYLEMTGDDLLSAGVTVMAQPPGKRNSTIHLLSGGEKALAAVALVFAIFELNPAPFCMLDEVDAPLDDANVARFCDIVREMSERVQFVFITHNKVTMEMSRQLSGVTMQEPGVSRLVSVDLDEAVQLAAS
jgi:chromosome segregation protein